MFTFVRFLSITFQALLQLSRYALGRLFYLLFFFMWPKKERRRRVELMAAKRFTAFFRNLRATFVKLGQILSARPDMFGPHMIRELQTLQDDVPPFPRRHVATIIERDLGAPPSDLFDEFSATPIAAASIAQVHEARLHSGQRVAVKIQRPGIGRIIARDLAIFGFLARVAHIIPGIRNLRLPGLAKQFAEAIRAQLDFRLEVQNNRRFAADFADLDWVQLPAIYDEHCGDRVITMEFVQGRKLTEVLDSPPIDRAILAERMLDLYYRMAFKNFFLHADLHPGNVFVDSDGRFHLLDTGLVYAIPQHYVRKFFRVSLAMAVLDGEMVANAYLEGFDIDSERKAAAVADMKRLEERYKGRSFSDLEMGRVFLDILGVLRRNRIFLDAEWTGLALSDLTFEGMAKMLDADIDLMAMSARLLPSYAGDHAFLAADDPIVSKVASAAAT